MAPGGKAFIIFNFPPGVSLLERTRSVSLLRPGNKRPPRWGTTATAFHVSLYDLAARGIS
jgi:hypothetical protein